MLLTEEEARGKWCPYVRLPEPGLNDPRFMPQVAINRPAHSETNCLGSACMAWRWAFTSPEDAHLKGKGFCGAFGRPD